MIGVFENDDLVEALAFGGSLWVCVSFGNPESTFVVKGHSDRLMDLWFTCCELHMEAFGDIHVSSRVGAGEVFLEFLASFRLSGVQADTGELFRLMFKHMATEHTTDDDVGRLIAVDISDDDLSSDSGSVISEVRDPFDGVIGVAIEFEPIDYWAGIPIGALAVVRPVRFSGDDILKSIAVDICESYGV